MDFRRRLIWTDGSAAALAGVTVLLLSGWLSDLHRLPRALLLLIGVVNLVYASYSLTLARRAQRGPALIVLLVLGSSVWAVLCLRWAFVFSDTASFFGLAHLVVEGLFVGGLAYLEWRWRGLLQAT